MQKLQSMDEWRSLNPVQQHQLFMQHMMTLMPAHPTIPATVPPPATSLPPPPQQPPTAPAMMPQSTQVCLQWLIVKEKMTAFLGFYYTRKYWPLYPMAQQNFLIIRLMWTRNVVHFKSLGIKSGLGLYIFSWDIGVKIGVRGLLWVRACWEQIACVIHSYSIVWDANCGH